MHFKHLRALNPAPMVVRAGDLLRVGDDLRLAVAVAETALRLARDSGAPLDLIAGLEAALASISRRDSV